MIAGQTSRGANGYQNLLFPLPYMYISQGEGGSYSHQGTLNIDFLGYGANGRIYQCPYYAPCDLKLTYKTSSGYIYESIDKVNFVDGTLDYITLAVVHDDNHSRPIGLQVSQGDLLGHTGTYGNVTGDHVHMNVARGQGKRYYVNSYGNSTLQDSVHIYNAMGVNDTVIVVGYGYNWRSFSSNFAFKYKNKFPWVLYARKLREHKRFNLSSKS